MRLRKTPYFVLASLLAVGILIAVGMKMRGGESPGSLHKDELYLYEPSDTVLGEHYNGVRLEDVRSVGKLEIVRWHSPCPRLVEWIRGLEDIEELCIVSSFVSDDDLRAIARSDLIRLQVEASPDITSDGILSLPIMPNLTRLDIRECSGIDDRAIPWIEALPSLKELLIVHSGIKQRKRLEKHMEARGGKVLLGAWGE